jgi:hypothetical protein
MTAPATDLPTVEDFLAEATARLDRLAKRGLVPGSDTYELYRLCAQLTAAVRLLANQHRPA